MTSRKIGAHVSSVGGHDKAVERAVAIGANCLQVFSGSPRGWRRPDLTQINVQLIHTKQAELSCTPIFTHALYLINLTADSSLVLEKSVDALKAELQFDSLINGQGVVVHLGSHLGAGWEQVRDDLVKRIDQVLMSTPQNSKLLIENSAGQQGKLCSDLTEVKWLMDKLEKEGRYVSSGRLGWCLDTCHAWAAGYKLGAQPPFSQEKDDLLVSYKNPDRGDLISSLEELNLLSTLQVIHLNDSKDAFRSGRDRHENLGEGKISLSSFKTFVNYSGFKAIPLVTEVPGFDSKGPDVENIVRIKELVE